MENLYKVKSLNVVAYLRLNGFPISKVEKEGSEATFYFERSKDLFMTIDEYNANETLKKFISSFKEVRTIASSLK
jgi:hypothetical protein